jgi:hypothetical protein
MKTMNALKWAGIAALIFLLPGCASSGKGRDFSPYAPMGLAMVASNYDINWVGEVTYKSSGSVSDFVRRTLRLKTDTEKVRISSADDLINEADTMLREILTKAEIFRLEDKDRLLNTASYAGVKSVQPPNTPEKVFADAYRFINYRDKNFPGEIARETGIQSILYISFEFNKEMISGIGKSGKCRARVVMTATLVNPAGKIIYNKDIETHSDDKIEVKSGAYSQDELMELFKEPIGEACYRFVWTFTGMPSTR